MSYQDQIIEMVKSMEEKEAKKLLATIFLKLERINNYDFPKEKAFEEIRELYREEVVGRTIFDK